MTTTWSCSPASPARCARSLALRQERERGAWPSCFDELWEAIGARYGSSEAARQMVDVLLLCRETDPPRVELAARGALTAGPTTAAPLRFSPGDLSAPRVALSGLDARLAATSRPEPDLAGYDQLLDRTGVARDRRIPRRDRSIRRARVGGAAGRHDGVACSRAHVRRAGRLRRRRQPRPEPRHVHRPAARASPRLALAQIGGEEPSVDAARELLAGGVPMSTPAKTQAMEALIEAHAIELKLPTVRRRFRAAGRGGATRAADTGGLSGCAA